MKAFEYLKEKLISSPTIVAPDWNLPFELMCDASGVALAIVLGQRKAMLFHYKCCFILFIMQARGLMLLKRNTPSLNYNC